MAIREGEVRAQAEKRGAPTGLGTASPAAGGDGAGQGTESGTKVLYPPGIKLFGEAKRTRDRLIADEVRKHVDSETGRLRAEDAARVYREVASLFGLSA